jgi:hypothetical protein
MTEEIKEIKTLEVVPDPFDLENLIVEPDYEPMGKREITKIKVRRPGNQMWIRTHPEYEMSVVLFEPENDDNIYCITKPLQPYFVGMGRKHLLYPYVDTNNVYGLWPVKLPNELGELHSYPESAHTVAQQARGKWLRVESVRAAQQYQAVPMQRHREAPDWPNYDMSKWLWLGFKDTLIDALDHPIVQELELEYKNE